MNRANVILKSGKDQSLKRYHPWVFSGAIKKIKGDPDQGDVVEVYSNKDEFLGLGHYQSSSITVRVFTFEKTEISPSFWKEKITNAYHYRQLLGLVNNKETSVYRLINAEGDGMPGLIIDFYAGNVVMQIYSVGMFLIKDIIIETLLELYQNHITCIYNKSKPYIPKNASINLQDDYLYGKPGNGIVEEYGNKFLINWEKGQKTGFFIDQRENRKLLSRYSSGKKVLNMFGYTGGFSVYALKGGAERVDTVDSSKHAIEIANKNIKLNFENCNHNSYSVDAFQFMNEAKEGYDIVILDPPAFAKHNNVLHNALQGYKKLNAAGIQKVNSGGLLFTFSCSQVVSQNDFRKSIFAAAASAGREVKIMYRLSQPADHPVSLFHPEGEYLKGLALYVK